MLCEVPLMATLQCIVAFSQLTLHKPSFAGSQKVDTELIIPAPFFCMMVTITQYLNGRCRLCSPLRQDAIMLLDQSLALSAVYVASLRTTPMALLTIVSTSSTTKSSWALWNSISLAIYWERGGLAGSEHWSFEVSQKWPANLKVSIFNIDQEYTRSTTQYSRVGASGPGGREALGASLLSCVLEYAYY